MGLQSHLGYGQGIAGHIEGSFKAALSQTSNFQNESSTGRQGEVALGISGPCLKGWQLWVLNSLQENRNSCKLFFID